MAAAPDAAVGMVPAVPATSNAVVGEARRRLRCPGCRLDQRKAEREGMFPYKELFLIWLVTLCSSARSIAAHSHASLFVTAPADNPTCSLRLLREQFPYFLPSLSVSILALIALFSCFRLQILTVPLLSSYAIMPAVLSGFPLHLVVNCASFLKNAFTVSSITVFNVLINDAVVRTQDVRGQANGIAVTIMSISKAIAPAVAGIIFSWAQKRQKASFLPGDHLVFFMLNVVTVIGIVFTFRPFFVRSTINH
ncbi:hypothetical protein C2845_PM14G01370 [Panicum miliaceum]|uniref:Major facilitator superfamily (MFS) profile domain-containing protein n=1 Tax=Panicum miliaceum TaxID=4540 RepID=A0A3L6PJW6_PANMI|nr:hypothetical protein C2845_PM14G01370 [Panicum miliaceum]